MHTEGEPDLDSIVRSFRFAFETLAAEGRLPSHMRGFPNACCGVASQLLGEYLNGQLGLGVELVCGERNGTSHTWLEHKDLVIDITIDQFPGRLPVFIGPKDSWHRAWSQTERRIAAHDSNAWTYCEEHDAYEEIVRVSGLAHD